MIEFVDKTLEQDGTPINRANMMGVQGMSNKVISFTGSQIWESDVDNNTYFITTFVNEKTIEQTLTGSGVKKTMKKTITFNDNGSISEVIS